MYSCVDYLEIFKLQVSIFSKGDHTTQRLYGLELLKKNIYKLQLMQNFAACILTNTKKFDHISPVLHELA